MLAACIFVLVVFVIGVGLEASGTRWAPRSDTWKLGGDFVELYTAGRVLNERQGGRLYDLELEAQISRELVPGTGPLLRAFAYPPFVAMIFQPLARLPYRSALAVFLALTPIVFAGALLSLAWQFGPASTGHRALTVLAGLSFFPFLGYTWLGAQISVIGFAAIALALAEDDRGRYFTSGLALSLCLYKPTLLVLIVPMLVVLGRVRQIAGLVCGGAVLALVSWAGAGEQAMFAFADRASATVSRAATAENLFNANRYVDLNAFFRLLPYGRSFAGYLTLAALLIVAAVALVSTWWRARAADRATVLLVWAATLTWTLVANIYVPFYDTLLVVAAAAITVTAIRTRGWRGWHRLGPALLAVYVVPWMAEVGARSVRIQIYTLVLVAFGTLLLIEANRHTAPQV